MESFTLKDLILVNSPCFSCSQKINVVLKRYSVEEGFNVAVTKTLYNNFIKVNLRISYTQYLTLELNCLTNKFITNNFDLFQEYINKYSLYLVLECYNCGSDLTSFPFVFNSDFLSPLQIRQEKTNFLNRQYRLFSNYEDKTTIIYNNIRDLHVPLIPRSSFKNKKDMIAKIDNYLLII